MPCATSTAAVCGTQRPVHDHCRLALVSNFVCDASSGPPSPTLGWCVDSILVRCLKQHATCLQRHQQQHRKSMRHHRWHHLHLLVALRAIDKFNLPAYQGISRCQQQRLGSRVRSTTGSMLKTLSVVPTFRVALPGRRANQDMDSGKEGCRGKTSLLLRQAAQKNNRRQAALLGARLLHAHYKDSSCVFRVGFQCELFVPIASGPSLFDTV